MDSKMDLDVGKAPEPHRLSPTTDPGSIPTLDGWIESLMNCKQLAESDVSRLCDRVGEHSLTTGMTEVTDIPVRLEKFYKKNQTCSQWYAIANDGCRGYRADSAHRNVLSQFVEISMVNSTTSWSFSESAVLTQTQT